MTESATSTHEDNLVTQVSNLAHHTQRTIATAESLTGGQLAAALAAAPNAGSWFRGSIVAYHPEVKYTLLNTPRGPVVTAETAAHMASSAVTLLGADLAVAVTGVGGPEPDEGKPAGTVYLATCAAGGTPRVALHHFDGEPLEVMQHTIEACLTSLIAELTSPSFERS